MNRVIQSGGQQPKAGETIAILKNLPIAGYDLCFVINEAQQKEMRNGFCIHLDLGIGISSLKKIAQN